METLSFYDLRAKKKFTSSNYKIVNRKGRRFAVTTHNGTECWRILGKA